MLLEVCGVAVGGCLSEYVPVGGGESITFSCYEDYTRFD